MCDLMKHDALLWFVKKQDGIVYRILCECGKVYIGETGRPMQDRIKEHAHNTGHKPL